VSEKKIGLFGAGSTTALKTPEWALKTQTIIGVWLEYQRTRESR